MLSSRFFTLLTLALTVTPAVWAVEKKDNGVARQPQGEHSDLEARRNSKPHHKSNSGSHQPKHTMRVDPRADLCGVKISRKEAAAAERRLRSQRIAPKNSKAAPIVIPLYWHVIAANNTEQGGYISHETIEKSVQVLNDAYDLAMIDFRFAGYSYTYQDEWFAADWAAPENKDMELEVTSALRRGDAGTMNVWSKFIPGNTLGYATFPQHYNESQSKDGIVINYGTVPGGSMETYNLGTTLVHEAGHWLGLLHTFEGDSCEGPGDYVSDTPQQASKSETCEYRDTCTELPGGDPYKNYMDYAPDECQSEFTTGQIRRIRDHIRTYRGYEGA